VITADGIFWALARDESTSGGVTTAQMRWNGPWPADTWDTTVHGTFPELGMEFNYSSTNNGQWITVNSDDNVTPYFNTLLCPVDGMILIQVNGTNLVGTALDRHDMAFKDIKLNVEQLINQSTNITGQTHQDSGSSLIKAVQENDIPIDDSPRNTIAGTLFTDALSNFDYTDINTGEDTNIGDIYFTKTGIWHRKNLSESLRLGNIITQEILDLQYTSRRQVEGSFRNLRLSDSHVSILKLFRIGWLPGSNFLFSGLTIDYMNCKFSGKLVEVSVDEEGQPDAYKFNYLYGKSN
jgi:hypothetical protein